LTEPVHTFCTGAKDVTLNAIVLPPLVTMLADMPRGRVPSLKPPAPPMLAKLIKG